MKTIFIKIIGECTYNYDFEFEHEIQDDQNPEDLDFYKIGQDYFYENFPNEVDTNGFDVTSSDFEEVPEQE